MATGMGTATIDFGASPGLNETSVVVPDATISATSKCEAYVMGDDTSSGHTAVDHKWLPVLVSLTCGTPVAATEFTIYARSEHQMEGNYTVRWVWAD